MAWTLKESDIKSLLKWARSDTKKFVSAGFKGDMYELGKILSTYNFFATLDSSMASMIIAFIICCIKSGNSDLKKFGLSALRDGSSLNKLFEYLKEGNGKKVKDCMKMPFMIALDTILKTALPDDKDNGIDNKDKRAKIIKSFINRAGKITPWKINGETISNVIDRLIGSAAKEANKAMMQKEAIKNAPNAHHKMMREEAYDKKLKKERDDELKTVKSEFTEDKKGAAKSAAKNAVENVAKIRASKQPLLDAINSNDLESVKQIIKLYPRLLNLPLNSFGNTALLHAADKGQERIVDLLLEKGADPNIQNNNGETPLCYAAGLDNKEIVDSLLDHRADPNIQNNDGETPLYYAAGLDNKEIVDLLLKRGANPDIQNDKGRTVLYKVARCGHKKIVDLLLNHDANPNLRDKNKSTPVHDATSEGHEEIVNLLLNRSANPDIQDDDGTAPLHLAALLNYEHIVNLLLNQGADPNIQDNDGETPLCIAAYHGYKEIVVLLLKRGADPNIEDKNGNTPLRWAELNENEEIIRLLSNRSKEITERKTKK